MSRVAKELNSFPKAPVSNDRFTSPYSDKKDFSDEVKRSCLKLQKINSPHLDLKVCKIIILGDACVGKTSLLNRFCLKYFDCDYKMTIGVDFQTEQINILGLPYHLQIWDTAGQERFRSISQSYYRKSQAIIVVFDLSSIKTLANCKNWIKEALEVSDLDKRPYIFLVGTKKDLLSHQAIQNVEDIAQKYAEKLMAEFWIVSSKTGENVEGLFTRASALVFEDHIQNYLEHFNRGNRVIPVGKSVVPWASVAGVRNSRLRYVGNQIYTGLANLRSCKRKNPHVCHLCCDLT